MTANRILAIAIDEYDDPELNKIDNCQRDVSEIIKVLNERYQFDDTVFLYGKKGTTRINLLQRLMEYFVNASPDENVLLIFAGHGEYHDRLKCAYWQPSDSDPKSMASWIGLNEILSFIKASQAHHVSIISDSCYSGAIFENAARGGGVSSFLAKKSRQALTAGGIEKVSDGQKGGNSPFAETILEILKQNGESDLTFNSFANAVVVRFDPQKRQSPRWGDLAELGHAGGTFVFRLKTALTNNSDVATKNAALKSRLRNLYLTFDNDDLKIIDRIDKLKEEKNLVVKKQQYEKAAWIRDREKELIAELKERMSKLINDRQKLVLEKHEISKNDLEIQLELDQKFDQYIEDRNRQIETYKEWQAKVEAGQEPRSILLSGTILQSIFNPITNPILDLFKSKQGSFIKSFENNAIDLFDNVCLILGKSKCEASIRSVTELKSILIDLYYREIDILTDSNTDIVIENIWITELQLRFYNWLNGDWAKDKLSSDD